MLKKLETYIPLSFVVAMNALFMVEVGNNLYRVLFGGYLVLAAFYFGRLSK